MPFVNEAFGTLGDTVVIPGREIGAIDVRDADILAIRSTTRVDRALLDGSSVKFVGTATIGTDHIDTQYLGKTGITCYSAAGCNANSVSEYVAAALVSLATRHALRLDDLTLGVIGVGNVGKLVVPKAQCLGLRVLQNDPPRQRVEGNTNAGQGFVDLATILDEADIITLHVPLTLSGPDPTHHMADTKFFERVKKGAVLINSSRGAVVDSPALLRALQAGVIQHAVVDTWEDEPEYPTELLDAVTLGTPHIAGYSFEGRVNGTVMVYEAACQHLSTPAVWNPSGLLPTPPCPECQANAGDLTDIQVLQHVICSSYDIEKDDTQLRAGSTTNSARRGSQFDTLRQTYPVRREFFATKVVLKNGSPELARTIESLGFSVVRA